MILIFFLFTSFAHSDSLALGQFSGVKRCDFALLAAPHGGYDLNTEKLVAEISEKIKWSSVVAVGFRTKGHPYNVNRPTEGIGLRSDQEIHSPDALVIYEAYKKKVLGVKAEPRLYVEIHGESKLENRIEIATVGVSPARAARLKAAFQRSLSRGSAKYTVAIEGVDPISYSASAAKKFGILSLVPTALQIELPWTLRMEDSAIAIKALADFLPKAAEILRSDEET